MLEKKEIRTHVNSHEEEKNLARGRGREEEEMDDEEKRGKYFVVICSQL